MRSAVREIFGVAAARYDAGNPLLLLERPATEALLPPLAGLEVLDLGSGTGHYARLAAALGARLAVACDATPEMLARGPRPAVRADAVRLPFGSGSLDVVVAALLLSFVSDLAGALREIARVLRPGGRLLASDLHSEASRRGWRRSFGGPGGERLVIEAPPPEPAALLDLLARSGMRVEAALEPAVDERLRPAFRQAGRRDFDELAGVPLLQVVRARKEAADAG